MTRRRGQRTGALVLVALLAATVASCSLGDKQDRADAVSEAVRATVAAGPVTGSIRSAVRPRAVDVPAGFELGDLAVDFDPSAFRPLVVTAGFTFDHDAGTSRVTTDGGADGVTHVLFDDRGIRLRRPDAAPDDARPWLLLDYRDLTEGSGELESIDVGTAYGVLAVLDPRLVLDLAAGPLAGSIEDVDGDGRHFTANFDIPKALEDEREDAYDEDRLEDVLTLFDLLRTSGDVHDGEVWLAEDGTVERFRIAIHVKIERFIQADLELDIRPGDRSAGPLAPVTAPDADQIVLVDSIVPLRVAAAKLAPEDPLGGLLGG